MLTVLFSDTRGDHDDWQVTQSTVSDQIGEWIVQAQGQGLINPTLPPLVVLYTLYARACDPVVTFLKDGGQYSDAEIVELVVRTCFDGLSAR